MNELIIKIDIEEILAGNGPVIIDLGCGNRKEPGVVGIDVVDMPCVDIVADLENGLGFLPDKCVDEIHCRSVLEHLEDFEQLIREIVRVLKVDGIAHVFVPHFSNPYYYSDYTHKCHFGLYTFYYFVDKNSQLRRKVPTFYSDIRIRIIKMRLKFRSPFWFCNKIKKLFGWFVNLTSFSREFYEQSLCYIFPCDGIEIEFSPVDVAKKQVGTG